MDNCLYCRVLMHEFCSEECDCESNPIEIPETIPENDPFGTAKRRGPKEKVDNFRDAVSTGRKRAAKLYKIEEGQICDWAWKKNCGGGIIPVVGCSGRLATNIHHGPDKSVINNDRSNISVICPFCHNLWHAKNDPYYIEPRPADGAEWLPLKDKSLTVHTLDEIQDATVQEIIEHEIDLGRENIRREK